MNEPSSGRHTPLYRYRFGAVELDEARMELRVRGEAVAIEHKPVLVLLELLRRPEEVITRTELLEIVWHGRAGVRNVLSNAILKLRTCIDDREGERIVTVARFGYRFAGPVERIAVGRALSSSLALKPGDAVPHRQNFVLDSLIGSSTGIEVWLARHVKTKVPLVYKIDGTGIRLNSLKREAALYRVLHRDLGERHDLVQILDHNFETPPYYLECQYSGTNLVQWAAVDDRLRGICPADRIALFLQIADAVAAAHSVGVLHRDIKPSNILLAARSDGGWQARVADFGSGSLLDSGVLERINITELGKTVAQAIFSDPDSGTPLYVAPEVIAGRASTVRSDVYALGVLLYQIAAADLRKPMASDWRNDISDALLCDDIAAATAGDEARRIGSVEELSYRLRNLETRRTEQRLAEEAAIKAARAEHELEVARGRRPWLIAAVTILLVGTISVVYLYFKERDARGRAERETIRAESITSFLNHDMIGAADPIAPGQHHDETIAEALSRAAIRLRDRFSNDPATKGGVEEAIGSAYFGLGDYASAQAHQQQAVQLLVQGLGADDEKALNAEYTLARTLMLLARYAEADALVKKADAGMGRRLNAPTELALLAKFTRGALAFTRNQPQIALPLFQDADRIRGQILPNDTGWLFRVRSNLAWALNRVHRETDTVELLRPLLEPAYTLERIGIFDFTKVRDEYEIALIWLGRFDEATTIAQATMRDTEHIVGSQHLLVAVAAEHLAEIYQAAGQWALAQRSMQAAYNIIDATLGQKHHAAMEAYGKLGAFRVLSNDDVGQGLSMLRNAYDRLVATLGASDPVTQDIGFYYCFALLRADHTSEAIALVDTFDAAALTGAEPGYDWQAQIAGLKGLILLRTPRRTEGLKLLDEALDHLSQRRSSDWITGLIREAKITASRS